MAARDYAGVAVTTPVTVPYERYSDQPTAWWIARALKGLLDASGIAKHEVDGLAVSSFLMAPDTTVMLTEHFGLSTRWIEWIPNGGAAGVMALRRAARAIQAGDANIVACISGDTSQPNGFQKIIDHFSSFSTQAVVPYGKAGPNGSFALITQNYMQEFGARREDFGRLCVMQRTNAMQFPHALLRKPLTLEAYMAARPIAGPVHLFDCVMPCAGAEAFLVMSDAEARRRGLRYASMRGSIERHNAFTDDPIAYRHGWLVDRDALYAQASVGPFDMDLVETYDDYPVIVFHQFEDLGFCAKGEAAALVRDHDMTFMGNLPHNTSGGQLSVGQAGAAGGMLGLVEGLRQVTGQALGNQVADARLALICGFGMIAYDRALCTSAVILEGGR